MDKDNEHGQYEIKSTSHSRVDYDDQNFHILKDGKRVLATKEEAIDYCIETTKRILPNAPRTEEEFLVRHNGIHVFPYLVAYGRFISEDLFASPEEFIIVLNVYTNFVALDNELRARLASAMVAIDRELLAQENKAPAQKEHIPVMTSTLYHSVQSVLALGNFKPPDERENFPYQTIKKHNVDAVVLVKPNATDLSEPESSMEMEYRRLWQERMIATAKQLDDRTNDILDSVLCLWLEENSGNTNEPVLVKRSDILRMLGKKPDPRRGFKENDKHMVELSIHNLARVFIRVYEAEWEERTEKGQAIRRRGPVGGTGRRVGESAILAIGGREGEELLWGSIDYDAWYISLGIAVAPLITAGRQYGLLSRKVLELHPLKQCFEKRLARYLVWIWRCSATPGMRLSYKTRTLYDEIELSGYKKKPGKTIERLETALDCLVGKGIIAAWQYRDGYEQPKRFEDWLNETVTIEPPEAHKEISARINRPEVKPKPKAALPPAAGAFDQAAIKSARLARDLTQLQAAEELQAVMDKHNMKRTLSRTLLAKWESGKKKPDDTMKKILQEWIAGAV